MNHVDDTQMDFMTIIYCAFHWYLEIRNLVAELMPLQVKIQTAKVCLSVHGKQLSVSESLRRPSVAHSLYCGVRSQTMFKVNILLVCCLLCNYLWRMEVFFCLLSPIVFQPCVNYSLVTMRPQLTLTSKYCGYITVVQPEWSADLKTPTSHGHETQLSHQYSMRDITHTHTHTHTQTHTHWIRVAWESWSLVHKKPRRCETHFCSWLSYTKKIQQQ